MAAPLVVDIPHTLGRAEAKRRMTTRIGGLASKIPGGATVSSSWPGEDRMALEVRAMGQSIGATLDVGDTSIRATIALPTMLALMAGPLAAMVRETGGRLLLDDRRGGDAVKS